MIFVAMLFSIPAIVLDRALYLSCLEKTKESLKYITFFTKIPFPYGYKELQIAGMLFFENGLYLKALNYLNAAAKKNSKNDAINPYYVAWTLKEIGRLDEARKAYETAISINPKLKQYPIFDMTYDEVLEKMIADEKAENASQKKKK
jgi:tetratricopeptide (TPR) repeat protein